jgi:hypothetical protein
MTLTAAGRSRTSHSAASVAAASFCGWEPQLVGGPSGAAGPTVSARRPDHGADGRAMGGEWRSAAASLLVEDLGDGFGPQDMRAVLPRPPPTVGPVIGALLSHDGDLATQRSAVSTLRLSFAAEASQEAPQPAASAAPSTCVLRRGGRTSRPEWMRAAARERLGCEPAEIDGGRPFGDANSGPPIGWQRRQVGQRAVAAGAAFDAAS